MFNAKKITAFATTGLLSAFALGCSSPTGTPSLGVTTDVKNFYLSATAFTTINEKNKTFISATILWPALLGINYYKLIKTTGTGESAPVERIGPPKIANTVTSFIDSDLSEGETYSYIIKAYDTKNKVIDGSRQDVTDLTPIGGQNLPVSTISSPKDNAKIMDKTKFSWSTAQQVDMYYVQLLDIGGEIVMGAYTDFNTTEIEFPLKTSPIAEKDLPRALLEKLPIETSLGIEEGKSYKLRVVTIKSNTGKVKEAKAIGIRYSPFITVSGGV